MRTSFTRTVSLQLEMFASLVSLHVISPHLISSDFIRLAHSVHETVVASVVCLSVSLPRVRSRKMNEIGAKCRRRYGKSESPSKNMTSEVVS